MRTLRALLLFGVAMLIMAGTASATPSTVSASVGPVPVPDVPVEVCVDDDCQTTPAPGLSAVALRVEVTADDSAGLPTISAGECASGTGVALIVQSGSEDAVVGGEVSGTLPDGSPFSQPIEPVTVGEASTTVSACTTATGTLPDPGTELPDPGTVPDPELPGTELPDPELPGTELPGTELPDPGTVPDPELPGTELPDPGTVPDPELPGTELPDPGTVPDPSGALAGLGGLLCSCLGGVVGSVGGLGAAGF